MLRLRPEHGSFGGFGPRKVESGATRELASFWTWSKPQRLEKIYPLQSDQSLSKELVRFFRSVITDKKLDATTRNNIANALVLQRVKDASLSAAFAAMAQDRGESPKWRNYAVQHLAESVSFSERPEEMVALLWTMSSSGDREIQGTALLQLQRLDDRKFLSLGDDYGALLVGIMSDPRREMVARMTAIAVAGERQARPALPAVRVLASDADASLRRVAVAALGSIGDPADRGLILAAASDRNPTVKAAATGALRRLDTAQAGTEPSAHRVVSDLPSAQSF